MRVQNRQATISILPSSTALLIKELGEKERDRKKVKNIKHDGNLTLEQVVRVAKIMETRCPRNSRALLNKCWEPASPLVAPLTRKAPRPSSKKSIKVSLKYERVDFH